MSKWLGLMSGTSMDGIDAVLVSFPDNRIQIHHTHSIAYPEDIRQRLTQISQNQGTPDELGELDHIVGSLFAEAASQAIEKAGISSNDISAIGSHGQTIRHQPRGNTPFSLQIGDPNLIAEKTGVTTVADFRRRDMSAGGQGAPLVPAFHKAFFGSETEDRCILNLGGIANISWLPAGGNQPVTGFDTGPANALMDAWCQYRTGRPYDEDGRWAAEGMVHQELLGDMLSDGYFMRPPPKSTGKEKFNLEWVKTLAHRHSEVSDADVQRTLLELTIVSIARQLPHAPNMTIFACGGGTRNTFLMRELKRACSPLMMTSTADLGLDPQWVEPVAFGWLAKQTLEKRPGNLPEVTGASGERILGAVYFA
ncbi:anhydro-N-acetylmuramic acid kinase [Marinobacter lipolyticus SM19]|uniref:Anhydro-N-acetylmuramic acid kinase n=1 Tax=Marinobacter lipolyticus SM19 TaxID=1318628 RepID=R8AXS4_9GAMM|nr:anhydro-N-acetylmuramic acid kinase [Marinobacter lipolyticus]EON91112.1 anhydro-N-acetylmuramic acid kinase [Marinobacter lipolyticus SM19]